MGVVYVFTNKVNGKKYVGQTYDFNKRYGEHLYAARTGNKNCYYFQHALAKYGPENFGIERIICSDTDMDFYEKLIIKKLDTMVPNGYNLTEGGSNGRPSEETRSKISELRKGMKFSAETCAKISEARKGMMLSPETRVKMSESRKGMFVGDKHPRARAIELIHPSSETETFSCMMDACREYGLCESHLSKVARGKLKHHKHFKVKYI